MSDPSTRLAQQLADALLDHLNSPTYEDDEVIEALINVVAVTVYIRASTTPDELLHEFTEQVRECFEIYDAEPH